MALDVVEVLMRLLLVGEVTKGGCGALFEVTVPPLVVDDAVEAAACNCCWCAYSKPNNSDMKICFENTR